LLSRPLGLQSLVLLLGFQTFLFRPEVFQVSTERFRIPSDPSQVRLQGGDSPCDVAFLGCDAILLCLRSLQLISLVIKRTPQIVDLSKLKVEFMAAVIMRYLRGAIFSSETVCMLPNACQFTAAVGRESLASDISEKRRCKSLWSIASSDRSCRSCSTVSAFSATRTSSNRAFCSALVLTARSVKL
jgi:hypothetical protein